MYFRALGLSRKTEILTKFGPPAGENRDLPPTYRPGSERQHARAAVRPLRA